MFKGLSTAISGDTLRLAAGEYNAGTGEKFTTASRQVSVSAGVKIFGARADVLSELQGAPGDLLGLDLKGSTVIRNVLVTGFPNGIRASQGTLTLKNVRVDKARHGLALSGTAKATLSQGVIFVDPDPQNLLVTGIELSQQAQLVLDGGNVVGDPNTCATSARGMTMADASQATIKNIARFSDFSGQSILMWQRTKLTMTGHATIDRLVSLGQGCSPKPQVELHDSATFTLNRASINSSGQIGARGILSESKGLVTLDSAQVLGHSGAGIVLQGTARRLSVTGTLIHDTQTGIDARSVADASILVVSSTLSKNSTAIAAPFVKLRSSLLSENGVGVLITRSAVFSDLGQPGDPGRNVIVKSLLSGVAFSQEVINTGFGAVFASGNTWNAGIQQADGNGQYLKQPLVTGSSPNARGTNFNMPSGGSLFEIQL
jgi:hypothetical protein